MRASYQDFEWISNKNSSIFRLFCTNCCCDTFPFSKKRVTTVTHINLPDSIFSVHLFIQAHPQKNLIHPALNPSTLLKNDALSLSFGIIPIRYKQKTSQHRSHISFMDQCLTRLIKDTVRKKTYHTKLRYVGTVRFKNWTEVGYAGMVRLKVRRTVRSTQKSERTVLHCHRWLP